MKGILQLYIKMLRTLGYDTIKQCKARISKQDLRFFKIVPEQHDWKYCYQALQYIKNEGRKTTHRRKSSVSVELLNKYREDRLADMDKEIASLPRNSKRRASLEQNRARIEESLRLP